MKGSVKLMGKRRFTPEYKEEIIKLVTERKKKISEIARDIGVTSTSIRRWITQYSEYGKDAFPGRGNLTMVVKIMSDSKRIKEKVHFYVSRLAGSVHFLNTLLNKVFEDKGEE